MTYDITSLTTQEIGVIYQALGELPLKISANLFGKIQYQTAEQDAKAAIPLSSLDLNIGAQTEGKP